MCHGQKLDSISQKIEGWTSLLLVGMNFDDDDDDDDDDTHRTMMMEDHGRSSSLHNVPSGKLT